MKTLTVIGGGPGDISSLTGAAVKALKEASRVYGAPRLAKQLERICPHMQAANLDEILTSLESKVQDTAVVVSGDTGFYSFARILKNRLSHEYQLQYLPGISSLQAFCAKLGMDWQHVQIMSMHGISRRAVGPVSFHSRTFFLAGGEGSANAILGDLAVSGLGHVQVYVGENLAGPEERIRSGTAEELAGQDIQSLAVVLVENTEPASRSTRLRDSDFIRGKVPMTKEPIRVLAVSRMEILPTDIVYDIGAGTGSVSMALARLAWDGTVYAVERGEEALSLLDANRRKLGCYNVQPVPGNAPEGLRHLPPPDKVFIGGSGGRMGEILTELTGKGNDFTVCITAITLESIYGAVTLLESGGYEDVEMEWVQVSNAWKTGSSHLMQGMNPVALISGRWRQ